MSSMTRLFFSARALLLIVVGLLSLWAGPAAAQTQAPTTGGKNDGWRVAVYPVLAWVPLSIGMDVSVPPSDTGGDGGGGKIVDSRFDGAFFGGVSADNTVWRVDADGLWAAFGGDRPERPILKVDVDVIYFHAVAGRAVAKDFYVTGGVRRLALKYDIKLGDRPDFSRKPGVWDPIVGLGYHRVGEKLEFHGVFEGGGFGVGTDVELNGSFRADWKPVRHFGLTAGYNLLYFKLTNTVLNRDFTVTQTVHGPIVGIGLYF